MSAGDMATAKQLTMIAAALGEHDVKDRTLRLAIISGWVGCPIATMKDLMRVEASYIIDFINREAESGELVATITKARESLVTA
jgi:hypothetical protein